MKRTLSAEDSFHPMVFFILRDASGQWEYDFPVDINESDVTGQTCLYLACCVSSVKIVEQLLNLKVTYT